MENREIAAVLEEISSLMRIIQDDPKWSFKSAAYDRAKRSIESHPERLEDIAHDPNRKLTDIPGVGADLAKKITELVETGRLAYHQEQLAKVPRRLLELLQLQTVGPQKVRLFYQQANICTSTNWKPPPKKAGCAGLPGMNQKSEENILKAIEVFRRAVGRFRLDTAYVTAEVLTAWLRDSKAVEEITPAGSLRRGRETVGDLDLLVTGRDPGNIADHFVKFPVSPRFWPKARTKSVSSSRTICKWTCGCSIGPHMAPRCNTSLAPRNIMWCCATVPSAKDGN